MPHYRSLADPGLKVLRQRVADLERDNNALTAALRSRDDFMAHAAHELRNPMTTMVGQVQLLRRQVKQGALAPDRVEAGLARLEDTILRYVKRATTLLDVSRINAGRLQLRPVRTVLGPLITQVTDELQHQAAQAGTRITVTMPEGITGTWDRLAMEQVLDNLLGNAIKYGGGTPIHVSADLVPDSSGHAVHIRVADGGRGIPEADRARVFERFERAAGAGRRPGFGVGLWIVRELVQAIGGIVELEDQKAGPGMGTVFRVMVPLHSPGAVMPQAGACPENMALPDPAASSSAAGLPGQRFCQPKSAPSPH